jgi:hypothetical protein
MVAEAEARRMTTIADAEADVIKAQGEAVAEVRLVSSCQPSYCSTAGHHDTGARRPVRLHLHVMCVYVHASGDGGEGPRMAAVRREVVRRHGGGAAAVDCRLAGAIHDSSFHAFVCHRTAELVTL